MRLTCANCPKFCTFKFIKEAKSAVKDINLDKIKTNCELAQIYLRNLKNKT